MRSRVTVFLILTVSLVVGLLFARQAYLSKDLPRAQFEIKKLRLLTYSTFVGASGPGPELIAAFKASCRCDVDVVSAGDAGLLLERLKIAEQSTPFDVVLGLDQHLLQEAERSFKWREQFFGQSGRDPILAEYASPFFVPIDWSPMTFIYRKDGRPVPESFDELVDSQYVKQFALQDPRSSTPGLQFLNWVRAVKGNRAQVIRFLQKFKPNVNSISPSWAFAYGLFKKEQTRFVFSYVTSLAFHWGYEKNHDYQVLSFPEGHPVQVEFVGIPASCRECGLAEKFVESLLQPAGQKLIMEKNFMFPVIKGLERETVFGQLPQLKTIRTDAGRDISEWEAVFKR